MYLDVDRDVAVVMLQHTNLIVFLHTTRDLPLLFVEPKTSIRRFFFRVLQRKELEAVVLVSILLNAGCSGLITLKPSWQQQQIASHAEVVLSGVFSLELMIRLTAYHPRAFLQSYWNVLDCVLVLSTIAAVCLTATPSHLRPFEVPISPQLLRTARTFRAARLIRFSPAVMASLAEALPKMLTLILLCLIVLFGCASMGVSMLSNICLLGDETLSGDNALRCTLVNDEGKLLPHSNFRNILMSLLTLVRFSTGDGWVEIMHRSALVSHDFPREKDAVKLAARALARYQNSSRSADERRGWLKEARMHLAGCVREDEMRQLQQLGAIDCSAYSFGVEIKVPCQGTCGTNLSKFAIPAFSLISTFLLLNLSAAIMIESLKMAHRFSGHRALLTKNMTKKRLNVIWALWQQHAQARGKYSEERPEIGKVLLTIQRAVDLPDLYYTRHVQAYCAIVLHSTYRSTSHHRPSATPEWNEDFSMPLRTLPTQIVIRMFDRSGQGENFLGETRIQITESLLNQPKIRSTLGGKCVSEEWYALRGLRSGGEAASGRLRISIDFWGAKRTLNGLLQEMQAEGKEIPETPVYACSPGILGLQEKKKQEDDKSGSHKLDGIGEIQEEIYLREHHDLRESLADSQSGGIFKRVSSSERLADRESKISALLELDGVECVGHAPEAGQKGEADQVAPKDAHLRDVSRSTSDSGKSSAAAGPCRTQRAPLSSSVSSESQSSLTLDSRGRKEDVQTGQVKVVQDSELMISKAAARVDILNAQLAEAGLLSRHMLEKNQVILVPNQAQRNSQVIPGADADESLACSLHSERLLTVPLAATEEVSLDTRPSNSTSAYSSDDLHEIVDTESSRPTDICASDLVVVPHRKQRRQSVSALIRSDFPRNQAKISNDELSGDACTRDVSARGGARPPTRAQIQVLKRRGVPEKYLPSTRKEASDILRLLLHARRPAASFSRPPAQDTSECSNITQSRTSHQLSASTLDAATNASARHSSDKKKVAVSSTSSRRNIDPKLLQGLSHLSAKAVMEHYRHHQVAEERQEAAVNDRTVAATVSASNRAIDPRLLRGLSDLSAKAVLEHLQHQPSPDPLVTRPNNKG